VKMRIHYNDVEEYKPSLRDRIYKARFWVKFQFRRNKLCPCCKERKMQAMEDFHIGCCSPCWDERIEDEG
jgi:hypothetical protein